MLAQRSTFLDDLVRKLTSERESEYLSAGPEGAV
jgi:hypothetical protein